ncbi:MAG: hypothetical protein R6V77_03355 [Candidatus Cloacimonadaceae bacterium]
MQYYLGIDPGRKGGFALIDEYKNLIYIEPMPLLEKGYNYPLMVSMIEKLPDTTNIILELKPGVMEQSASPTTSFGFHCGALYGICLKHRLQIVSPKSWKAEFDVNRNYKESRQDMKLRSVQMAEKLFNLKFKSTEDGLAEALLLAEYGRRHHL